MDFDVSLDYTVTLLAALLIGTGFVLQQQQAQREPDSAFLSLRLIADLLHAPRWLAGIGFMIGGQVLAAWSIGHLSLAFVEPLLTTNLVFALLLAVPLAKASLKVWEILGAVVLCAGVGLLSASRSAKPIGLSFGSFSHWPAAAAFAALAFVAVQAGRRRPGRIRAMLTGTGAGLVFGIQDALTRQTLQILQEGGGISALFTHWAPYALAGAGATGIWLMQSAFSAGPLQVSLPAISAGEPLVGIALGIVVFGDRVQVSPGELAIEAGGIVALVIGVIMVGRAPALTQLRAWTPPGIGVPHVPHVPGHRDRPEQPTPPGPPSEHPEYPEHPDRPASPPSSNGRNPELDGRDPEPNGRDPGQSGHADHTVQPSRPDGTAEETQPDMRGLRRAIGSSPRPPPVLSRPADPTRRLRRCSRHDGGSIYTLGCTKRSVIFPYRLKPGPGRRRRGPRRLPHLPERPVSRSA